MNNPLFEQLGNQTINNNEIGQFIQNVKQAQQMIRNPQQQVERMLQSGQLSQADFNRYSQIANQISKML